MLPYCHKSRSTESALHERLGSLGSGLQKLLFDLDPHKVGDTDEVLPMFLIEHVAHLGPMLTSYIYKLSLHSK